MHVIQYILSIFCIVLVPMRLGGGSARLSVALCTSLATQIRFIYDLVCPTV